MGKPGTGWDNPESPLFPGCGKSQEGTKPISPGRSWLLPLGISSPFSHQHPPSFLGSGLGMLFLAGPPSPGAVPALSRSVVLTRISPFGRAKLRGKKTKKKSRKRRQDREGGGSGRRGREREAQKREEKAEKQQKKTRYMLLMVIPSVNPSERLPEGARARGRGRGTAAPAHPEIPLGAGLGGTQLPGHPGALPVPNPSPPTPGAASPARFVPNPAGSRQEFRSCSAPEFRLFHVQARPELQMFRDGLGSCCPSCGPDIPERRPCPPRGAGIP